MKVALIISIVFAMGCASNVDVATNSAPKMDQTYSQRADFSAELAKLSNRESLTKWRSSLTEQQKLDWLGSQVARCDSLYGHSELAQRCAVNEATVLRLFTIFPVKSISEEQFLVMLEVYDYYASIQRDRDAYALVYVNFPEQLSASHQDLLLSQTASPLALFIVSIRDVLNEEDTTVY
jgi:hypothetical protein